MYTRARAWACDRFDYSHSILIITESLQRRLLVLYYTTDLQRNQQLDHADCSFGLSVQMGLDSKKILHRTISEISLRHIATIYAQDLQCCLRENKGS